MTLYSLFLPLLWNKFPLNKPNVCIKEKIDNNFKVLVASIKLSPTVNKITCLVFINTKNEKKA